jgi:hypothetical protein
MNRRNLFQACAAGLAWFAGGKAGGTVLQRTSGRGPFGPTLLVNEPTKEPRTIWWVVNGGTSHIAKGNVLQWASNESFKPYDCVENADLSGVLAGISLDDAAPREWFRCCAEGICQISTTR